MTAGAGEVLAAMQKEIRAEVDRLLAVGAPEIDIEVCAI